MESVKSDTNTVAEQPEGHREPAKVPFIGAQIMDHAMHLARIPARKFYWEPELLFNTIFAVDRWYGFDGHFIFGDQYNLDVEALGGKLIYSDFAMPTVDCRDPLIKKSTDLDKLGPLDPNKGRIPFNVELTRLIVEKLGPSGAVHLCGPFSFICQAMGYANVIMALRRDKSFGKALFEYAENEVVFRHAAALAEVGAKAALGMDAWCVFPNITPALGEEWIVPSALRLMERAERELGLDLQIGNCVCEYCEEDPERFDKDIMFRCYDVMQKTWKTPMLFNLMGRTQDWDMSWVQEYAVTRGVGGKKIPIWMSLNARFVRDGTPHAIFDKVREWIDIMGRDGSLMLAMANIPADTAPVNVHTAVSAVNHLGLYPVRTDLLSIPVQIPSFQPFDEWLKDQPEADIVLNVRR
jgi:uroporphyrinogen-III decarboxylase